MKSRTDGGISAEISGVDNIYPPDDPSLDPETHFENIYFILWMYPSNVIFLGDICIEWDEITTAMFWL